MKVKFLSNISYQTYPIADNMIDIDEVTLKEIGKTKQFVGGKIIDYSIVKTNKQQIDDLKQKLYDTDYMAIKYAECELTEEEYAETKAQRKSWREEIRQLENGGE